MVTSFSFGRKVGSSNRLHFGRKSHGTRAMGRKGVRHARKLSVAGAHNISKPAAVGGGASMGM